MAEVNEITDAQKAFILQYLAPNGVKEEDGKEKPPTKRLHVTLTYAQSLDRLTEPHLWFCSNAQKTDIV